MSRALRKYLERYAEPEREIAQVTQGRFAHALVIPSYGEGSGLFETLESVPAGVHGNVLRVVVLNEPKDASLEMQERNRLTLRALKERFGGAHEKEGDLCFESEQGPLIVLDHRSFKALPPEQGVGLARKIGMDFVLRYTLQAELDLSWIHTTDADAKLPEDYFESAERASSAVALSYAFKHRAEPGYEIAVAAYDAWLRYYIKGLAYAGSPYAYHSIGSCMAVRPNAYAQVRGVPKRAAGEDFHLLNKLRKVGEVHTPRGEPLVLSGRVSKRVPFGTGQAVAHTLEQNAFPDAYNPRVFECLREVLLALERADNFAGFKAQIMTRLSDLEAKYVISALEELGLQEAFTHVVENTRNPKVRIRQLHQYFDALKTLRFVHLLRDRVFANVSLKEALKSAPFNLDMDVVERADTATWERDSMAH